MRKRITPLLALLLLAPATPVGPSRPLGAECPAFEHVDRSKLSPYLNGDPNDPRLDAIWAGWATQDLGIVWRTVSPTATIHVESTRGALEYGVPGMRVVVGRRSAEGWEAYAKMGELVFGDQVTENWSAWRELSLSRRSQDRIDALLAGPCLWRSIRFIEQQVPLKNGRYDARPDGPSNYYDVTRGEDRWGGLHMSWTVGAPGRLRAILFAEAFGESEYPADQIGPDGWFDQPSH